MITEINRHYLEIKNLKDLSECKSPSPKCNITLINPPDFQINKFFYKQIGKKHRWLDRLSWEDEKWISYTNNPNVKTYVLKEYDDLVGYFEQIYSVDKISCEIAYFGVLEEYFGKKYGGYLLSEAIKESFKLGVNRVWVHTCSLDHKNALKNYISRGMKVFKSETIFLDIN